MGGFSAAAGYLVLWRLRAASSPIIVVVVRLRVIVIFHHRERNRVAAPLVSGTHSLDHRRTSIGKVPMDGHVAIVLELKLLLSRDRNLLRVVISRLHLSSCQLLRLQSFLVSTTAWGLATLALSDGVFLVFFKLAAIHVL